MELRMEFRGKEQYQTCEKRWITHVKIEHIKSVCRICLLNVNDENITFSDIFEVVIGNNNFTDILLFSVALKVLKDDQFPHKICETCLNEIIHIYNFRKKCEASQNYLGNIICSTGSSNASDISAKSVILNETDLNKIGLCDNISEDIKDELPDNYCGKLEYPNNNKKVTSKAMKKILSGTKFKRKCNKKESKHNEEDVSLIKDDTKCFESKIYCEICKTEHIQTGLCIAGHKKLICEDCGKSFHNKSNFKRHELTVHGGKRPYTCDTCGKSYTRLTNLLEHKIKHTGQAPHCCKYCELKFVSETKKIWHERCHEYKDTKQFDNREGFCEVCNRMFNTKTAWLTHQKTHGEKKFLCSYCGKDFHLYSGLVKHIKIHTGERRHVCKICDKAFTHANGLKVHTFIHTGEKPFLCKQCGKSFKQGSHLATHARIHTNLKPHSCSYCGKCFKEKGMVKVHERIHTGEKPFVCDVCKKGFYDSSSMKKHKKTHIIV